MKSFIFLKAPSRKYGLRDRSTLKPRTYRFPSDYSQVEVFEQKDDEEEQIKRATEESLRDYHKQTYNDVTELISETINLKKSLIPLTLF